MYINLPGSYVQLQDGNLRTFARDNTQSVLVVGTASKGLTSEPFVALDLLSVVNEFGATSEVAKTVAEVRKGGATNIYVYRLPGVAPELTHIGSDVQTIGDDAAGISIRTLQESPEAAPKYGVAYRHVKQTGPASGAVDTRELLGELIVVNLSTSEVVWQGSALEGSVLDTGEVDVQFELNDIDEGRGGDDLESIKFDFTGTTAVAGTLKVYVSGVEVALTVTVGHTPSQVASAFVSAFNALDAFDNCLTASISADVGEEATVIITADGTANADGDLVYPAEHPWAGYTARPFFSGAYAAGTTTIGFDLRWTLDHGRASDIGLYPQDVTKPFAAAGGGIYVPLDKVVSGGSFKSYGLGGSLYTFASRQSYADLNFEPADDPTTLATFSSGQTGESISLMKRFEKLHTAFENLDLASFDFIVPVGVALNSKNTADMIASTNVDFFTDDTYPTPRNAFDYLGYCAIVNNGDYTYTYLWSDDGENLKIASDGPIAAHASDSVTYNEVNFAHLLSKYCYENSTDYRFIFGLIGTSLPDGVSPRSIRSYFGSSPDYQFNADDNTFYVPDSSYNGTGLLGNKFVGGRHDFNDGLKHGGFFLTSDGTLDYSSSNLLLDDNGYKIDIGKHIGVVSIFGRVSDDINSRRNPYFTNAVAIVAGMLPNTSPSDSLINRRVSGLTIDYRLETKLIDVACGLGLIVAKNEGGIASIADSPTFASPTSDYTRLTTIRIVSKISEDLRLAARPYIGKGLSAPRRAALEAALGEVLKANIAGEPIQTITGGTFRIEQTAADKVLGKMKIKVSITPVFELRQIIFSVNLSAQ